MISTPIRRYGAAILMLLTCIFSGSVLATTHTATTSHKAPIVKKKNTVKVSKVSSKQEYSRNSVKSSSLAKIPFRNTKEKSVSPDGNALYYETESGDYCRS